MSNNKHLVHANSSVLVEGEAKLPLSSRIKYGELAINYAKDHETISLRNSNDEIVKFVSEDAIDNKLDKTEKVVASSLIDLDDRITTNNDLINGLSNVVEQNEKVVASSLIDLDDRITTSNDLINGLSNVIEQNEMVVASSLTDLNDRKADKTDIPTNISSFTNDVGYLTAHQDISGKADKMLLVNHGTSDTTFELTPKTKHDWGEVSSLTITLGTEITGIVNVFYFQFDSGSTATTLSLPASVKWNYDEQLVVLPNTRYQISIEGGIATVGFASLT